MIRPTHFAAGTALLAAAATAPGIAQAQNGDSMSYGDGSTTTATATLNAPDGSDRGSIELIQTPNGVLLVADLSGIEPGVHGFHIHETGECSPDFQAAGGHFAEGHEHGYFAENGPHPGDMPNIHVPDSGELMIEVFNPMISLQEGEDGYLFDADGSSIMIHAGADDYESQPSGDAGDRLACGVIEQP